MKIEKDSKGKIDGLSMFTLEDIENIVYFLKHSETNIYSSNDKYYYIRMFNNLETLIKNNHV